MQTFLNTKGFCNKQGLFKKTSLLSINNTFAVLEKLKFYRKKKNLEKIEPLVTVLTNLDYGDIRTIAIWTTKSNRLTVYRPFIHNFQAS